MTILSSLVLLLLSTTPASANPACAVCTVAVAASLELARYWGVDDSVVGVWSGAFLALLGYWMILWFDKKKWNFKGRNFLLIALSVSMICFMYIKKMVYSPEVILWILYIDPFLFSVILGAVVFIYASLFYQWMKAGNGGRAHFPFEKVVVPVAALVMLSIYFYYYPLSQKAQDLYSF
jgi:DMSO reductase anchor subunit